MQTLLEIIISIILTFPLAFPVKIYSPFLSNVATMFCSHYEIKKGMAQLLNVYQKKHENSSYDIDVSKKSFSC